MSKHEITMNEVKALNCNTFSLKDNSARGCHTVMLNDLKEGDMIVINNYFTEITPEYAGLIEGKEVVRGTFEECLNRVGTYTEHGFEIYGDCAVMEV